MHEEALKMGANTSNTSKHVQVKSLFQSVSALMKLFRWLPLKLAYLQALMRKKNYAMKYLRHHNYAQTCENKSRTISQQVTINHSHTMRCDRKSVIPSINYIFDTWVQHLLYYYDSNYVESSSSSRRRTSMAPHTVAERCCCAWFILPKVKRIIYQEKRKPARSESLDSFVA